MDERVRLEELNLGRMLGEGGQGRVFDLGTDTYAATGVRCVAKLYIEDALVSPDSLGSLVRMARRLTPGHASAIRASTAWPVQVIEAKGRAAGIVMQRVPEPFYHDVTAPSGRTTRPLCEAFWLFAPPARTGRSGVTTPSDAERRGLCEALAGVIGTLHANGAVYGDFSARNILWTTHQRPAVFVLDCDGVRRIGAAAPLRQMDSPDWGDPAFTTNQTLESDRYKYGLFVTRVFARDLTTRQGIDPAVAALGKGARIMLERAVSTAEPGSRPTMDDWLAFFASGAVPPAPSTSSPSVPDSELGREPEEDRWEKGPDGRWRRSSIATAPNPPAAAAAIERPSASEWWVIRNGKWVRRRT